MPTLLGMKILVMGPTGQVGTPVTLSLAHHNDVWGVARFKSVPAREVLEAAGVHCVAHNLATDAFDDLPADFDYVINLAVVKSGHWDKDLAANAESLGLLMAHCRTAKAVLHCSTTGVYAANGRHPHAETDPLGDNHRTMMPTYSITKIAAEAVARSGARQWGLPTVIARLNVPYGDNGGWPAFHLEMLLAGHPIPVHPEGPSVYNPIHEDDIVEQIPRLLDVASVPATTVNWAGPETVSIEDWCAYLGSLVDKEPSFVADDTALESVATDNRLMHRLIGNAHVDWHDGFARMVAARHPEFSH